MNILIILLISFQQTMFSLTLFATLYQFLINKYNQIYALNVSLSSILYLLLSIIFIDGQFLDKHFLMFQSHDLIQFIIFFIMYTDLSYVSHDNIINRSTEQIFKTILTVLAGIQILLNKNIFFDYFYLAYVSFIFVYIILSIKISKHQIIRIAKNAIGLQFFCLVIINGYNILNTYIQIMLAIYQFIWLIYYYNSIWKNTLC